MNTRTMDPHPNEGETASREARLSAFVHAATGRPARAVIGRRYAGGFSWQTHALEVTLGAPGEDSAETLDLILRIGHVNGLLSPYSTAPEAAVSQALAGSTVPVPRILWHTDDGSVIGSPFLVMEKAHGTEQSPFARAEGASPSASLAGDFTSILAALHNLPWEPAAKAGLRPVPSVTTAAALQVHKWSAMVEESGLPPRPALHAARAWLWANAPQAPRICIVHGDYRTGNFLQAGGRITAILDWELVHLGDPHEDIAWASLRLLSGRGSLVSGLVPPEEFRLRYERATGMQIQAESVRYYEVLALYKICAMNLRAAARVEQGIAPDARMTALGLGLPRLEAEITRLLLETP